jgi:hypothetical protein
MNSKLMFLDKHLALCQMGDRMGTNGGPIEDH